MGVLPSSLALRNAITPDKVITALSHLRRGGLVGQSTVPSFRVCVLFILCTITGFPMKIKKIQV